MVDFIKTILLWWLRLPTTVFCASFARRQSPRAGFRHKASPVPDSATKPPLCRIPPQSLPCVRGGGSAVGGDERVARQQWDFRPGRSVQLHCLSGTAIPQSRFACQLPLHKGADNPSVTATPCQLPLHRGADNPRGGAAEFPVFPLFFPFPFLQRRLFYVNIINRSITLL